MCGMGGGVGFGGCGGLTMKVKAYTPDSSHTEVGWGWMSAGGGGGICF